MVDEKNDATKPAAKKTPAKSAAEKAPAKSAAEKKPASAKSTAVTSEGPAKASAAKSATAKSTTAKSTTAKAAAPKAVAVKAAAAEQPAAKTATPKTTTTPGRCCEGGQRCYPHRPRRRPLQRARSPRRKPRRVPQILKAHHLRPATGAKTAKTRVGRGEGSKGKTAGRGTKGTKARYQVRAGLEGGNLNSIMRAPKLRGFTNPFRVEYQVVNLERLAELYPAGGDVTVGDLVDKGAVRKNEKVKVLGGGDIAVKLNVTVDKVSASAEEKIVAAGGTVQ